MSLPPLILLVHFEPSAARQMRDLLGEIAADWNIVDAEAGAVQALRLEQGENTVTLVGAGEGDSTGNAIISALRESDDCGPIIRIADTDDRALDDAAIAAGADDVLSLERLTPTELSRAIRHAVGRCHYRTRRTTGERADAENALSRSEMRLQMALRAASIIVFTQDLDLRYTWVANPATGIADQIVGRKHADLLDAREADMLDTIKQSVIDTGIGRHETIVGEVDGRKRYYDLVVEPMRDNNGEITGVIGSAFDLTLYTESRNALRSQQELFRALIDHSPTLVYIKDAEGRYLLANQRYATLLGLTPEGMIGRLDAEIFPAEVAEEYRQSDRRVLLRQHVVERVEIVETGGDPTYWHNTKFPIVDNAGIRMIGGSGFEITDRVRAEQSLRKNEETLRHTEERFRIMLKTSSISIFTQDLDLRYTWVANSSIDHGENLIGMRHEDYLGPVEAEKLTRFKQGVIDSGQGRREMISLEVDGLPRYFELIVDPMRDSNGSINGVIGSAFDMTAYREAENALDRERERISDIVASVPGIVWENWGQPEQEGRRVDFVSNYVETLLGYSAAQWLAVPQFWLSIVHPDDRERATAAGAAWISSGVGGRSEFRWITRDGRTIWVEVQAVVVRDASGAMTGLRGVTMDITERVNAQQALVEANDRLEIRVEERTAEIVTMMKRIEAASRTQKRFIADASHDLRTPLTVLRAELDLLLRNTVEPELRYTFERLDHEARRLDSLTGDLLVLATLEARDNGSGYRIERLDELMLECAAQLGVVALSRGMTWRVECEEPLEIRCDATAIKRMLVNIMDNAIKYSPRNGIVRMILRRMVVEVNGSGHGRSGERIMFIVRDSGAGISEQDLPHVFDRFYRGDLTRSTPGTGLGLAIVKAVADAHGADVVIDSAPGSGTTVSVSFPVASIERRAALEQPGVVAPPTGSIARLDEILFDLLIEGESDLGQLVRERRVCWQINCDEQIEIPCSPDVITRALTRMIESAVRNSERGGIVTVTLQRDERPQPHVAIIVHDDGNRLDAALSIVNTIASSLGGHLDIVHPDDGGTSVTMRLPL